MKETYVFTFRIGPTFDRTQTIKKKFKNQSVADSFASGLKRGGAIDVNFRTAKEERNARKR